MYKVIRLVLIVTYFLIPQAVLADIISPSSYCSKPYKPYKFNSQRELDRFNDEVQSYKSCINDFIEEQQEAAKHHSNAANEAIDEWNNFVNYELN